MESTTDAVSIEHEVTIAASPETVWSFLVDPDKATRWMGITAELDARPGGIYHCDVIPGHTASGEFVEVDPPRRLVYTWGWEPGADGPNPVPPGSSTIEIELVPEGDGTLLRFTHRTFRATRRRRHTATAGITTSPGSGSRPPAATPARIPG